MGVRVEVKSLIAPDGLDALCSRAVRSPPGDFVEVGVYQGGSALRLYRIAEAQGRTLHLFDTFTGHPAVDEIDHHRVGQYGKDAITPSALQELLPNARIYPGVFPDTLPDGLDGVAFVHADADLYASTLAICRLIPERMVNGGVMYFDDYGYGDCPGCTKAVDEVFGPPETPDQQQRVEVVWRNH